MLTFLDQISLTFRMAISNNVQANSLTLSLLCNNFNATGPSTTGFILRLDLVTESVMDLRTLADPNSLIYSISECSVQLLREPMTGHVFTDYSSVNATREYDVSSKAIMCFMFGQ